MLSWAWHIGITARAYVTRYSLRSRKTGRSPSPARPSVRTTYGVDLHGGGRQLTTTTAADFHRHDSQRRYVPGSQVLAQDRPIDLSLMHRPPPWNNPLLHLHDSDLHPCSSATVAKHEPVLLFSSVDLFLSYRSASTDSRTI